jgi:PAS domain S-box-containing protein
MSDRIPPEQNHCPPSSAFLSEYRNPSLMHFSVSFLLQMINSLADPIVVKNRQHHWIFFNDAFCNFMGHRREELIGKSDYDFFPKSEADVFWGKDELVFTTGITDNNKESFTDGSGTTRIIYTTKSLFSDEMGNQFLVGTIRDITDNIAEYQQVQAELHSSKQLFQIVMDNIPQQILWKDRNSVYLGCNKNRAKVMGLASPEDIIGKTDYDFAWTKEQALRYQESDRLTIESGIAQLHIIDTQPQGNGSQAWFDTNKIPLQDAEGNAIGVLVTIEDITEREIAQKHLNFQFAVNSVLAEFTNLEEDIPKLIQAICEHLDWDLGELWTLDKQSNLLSYITSWHSPEIDIRAFEAATKKYTFGSSVGLPGKTLFSNQPVWIDDINCDKNFLRSTFAGKIGLHSAFAFPIKSDDQIVGVVTLFSKQVRQKDKKLMAMMGALGSQLGQFLNRRQVEIALCQSEAKLQKLSANVPGMLYQLKLHPDGSQSFPYISFGCYQMYGLTPEEIQADPNLMVSMIHPLDRENYQQSTAISAETLQPWEYQGRIILASGKVKWLQASSRPELQADGSIIWDGLVMDISRLKQAEKDIQMAYAEMETLVLERTKELAKINEALQAEIRQHERTEAALRQSEARLNKLAANVPGMLYQFILQSDGSMKFQYISSGCYELCELQSTELLQDINLGISMIHPDDRVSFEQSIAISAQTLQPWHWEGQFILPSSKVKWLKGMSRPEMQENGTIIWHGLFLDVTDRKRAEIAVKESESQYRHLVETSQSVIWSGDTTSHITFANSAVKHIYGYEPEEIIGRSFRDLIAPERIEKDAKIFQPLLAGESVLYYETVHITKDGRRINVLANAIARRDEAGNIIGTTGTTTDITERKQSEQILRRNNAVLKAQQEAAIDGILIVDENRNFVSHNRRFSEIWQIQETTVQIANKSSELLPVVLEKVENPEEFLTKVDYLYQNIDEISRDEISLKDGRTLDRYSAPVHSPTRDYYGRIWYFRDITERKRAEKEQAKLVAILESSTDYVAISNADGYFLYMNGSGRRMLGFGAEEDIRNLHFTQIHPRHVVERFAEEMPKLLQDGTWTGESFLIHRNGTEIPVSQLVMVHRSESGEVEFLSAVSRNITEIKRAETELKASQQRLALLIKQTPIGVIEWNRECEIQQWNPAAERIFGYTKDEVIGCHFQLIVPENVKKHVEQLLDELLTQTGGNFSVNENITKDGRTIICEWYNSPLVADNGEVIGVASMVLDITERKQAETELQKFAALIKNSSDFISVASLTGEIEYVNPAGLQLMGLWSLEEARTKNITEFQPPEEFEIFEQQILPVMIQQGFWRGEFNYKNFQTGRIIPIDCNFSLVKNPETEEPICSVAVLRDITERKRAEALLRQQTQELLQALDELQRTQIQLVQSEKMSSLGQLVAGVAHEINNPVSFIYGNLAHADGYTQDLLQLLQLYQQHYPNPGLEIQDFTKKIELDFLKSDLPELLNSMKFGAERIREIVLSLRTFSRLDEAEMKAVDIHEGIDSTLMILQSHLKANGSHRGIEVIKEYTNLPLVECYAGQLNQVFMNILTNAIHGLEESLVNGKIINNPQIRIRTEVVAQNQVIIRIADNGIGIPEEIKQRLFDPFFTTKPVGKGTGMGLSICYQIITEKHGGCLECISQPGSGAEFAIAIPLKQN